MRAIENIERIKSSLVSRLTIAVPLRSIQIDLYAPKVCGFLSYALTLGAKES